MKPATELFSHSKYVRELRPLLPAEAFAPQLCRVWNIVAHYSVAVVAILALRFPLHWSTCLMLSLVIGHSFACLGFLAHDVSHNSIVKNRVVRQFLETFMWATIFVPVTVWKRVHNQTHHLETNTPRDPDRECLASEKSVSTHLYSRAFYPHRKTVRWNPLVGLHFIPYVARNVLAALLGDNTRPAIVPFKPTYTARQRISIFAELLVVFMLQIIIFFAVGGKWQQWAWASPIAFVFTSTIVMSYIFTNHFLNPLCEHTDPVVGSTSVQVPTIFDKLHDNFSFHTEHHIFPGMNPKYYPLVCRLLLEKFPERYNRLPLAEAWKRLWEKEEYIQNSGGDK